MIVATLVLEGLMVLHKVKLQPVVSGNQLKISTGGRSARATVRDTTVFGYKQRLS
jgi:hypothetical protein